MALRPHRQHHIAVAQPHRSWSLWRMWVVLVVLLPTQILALDRHESARHAAMSPLYYDALPYVPFPPESRPLQRVLPSQREIALLVRETLPQFDIDPRRVPDRVRRQVCQRVYDYTVLYRKGLQAMLRRADTHLPMIKPLLRHHGLPSYFAYIPLVESAFRVKAAHPKSGARGLWQFMANTARGYGLEVSARADERLHPGRATQAAARYLRTLQGRFGRAAPLHILAAYNFGENNLSKAMQRARTQDIWPLFVQRRLPYQTREYLVKMVALWVIVAQPTRFQLALDEAAMSPRSTTLSPSRLSASMEIAFRFVGPGE